MGFFDFFKRQKSIYLDNTAATSAQLLFRTQGASPLIYYAKNTDTYLTNGFEGNHVVFTIADWIAQKMTVAPPILYNIKDKSAAKDYKYLQKEGSGDNISQMVKIKNQAFKEIDSHPILDVLKQPNPLMSWSEFIYGYYIFKTFVGNSIIQGISTKNGLNANKIQQLYLHPSNYIQPVSGTGLNIIDYYQDLRNPSIKLPTEEILQIRNFSSDYRLAGSHLSGMSVLTAATRLLKQSNESLDAQAESYQNRGASKMIFPIMRNGTELSMPSEKDMDNINISTRKRIREAGNKGIIVNSVELGSIDIGLSPTDLGILESQKYGSQEWASLFHVDSRIVLNDHTSSTKDNMNTARLNSILDAVIPQLVSLANGLNNFLIPTYGDNLLLDFDYTVYPEVQRQLRETAKEMSDTGVFTTNEIRQMWKYGNYTGGNGDKILVGSTKQILDDLSTSLPDTTVEGGY